MRLLEHWIARRRDRERPSSCQAAKLSSHQAVERPGCRARHEAHWAVAKSWTPRVRRRVWISSPPDATF